MKRIGSFVGLKVIALALIVLWHTNLFKGYGDLGAVGVQFFFVVSGFLVAYNRLAKWQATDVTWKDSCRYLVAKLEGTWPLHIICCLAVFWGCVTSGLFGTYEFNLNVVTRLALNTFLLQAWSFQPISYNGSAWFLSALLFCYFCAPFLSLFVRGIKWSLAVLIAVLCFRYAIEWVQYTYPNEFWRLNYHNSPFVRCLEFFCGMLLFPIVHECRLRIRSLWGNDVMRMLWLSCLEILVILIFAYVVIPNRCHQLRGSLVLWHILLVFIFAFDGGLLSRLFGKGVFVLLSKLELEVFLLHQAVFYLLRTRVNACFGNNAYAMYAALIGLTLVLAILWRRYLQRPMSKVVHCFFVGMRGLMGGKGPRRMYACLGFVLLLSSCLLIPYLSGIVIASGRSRITVVFNSSQGGVLAKFTSFSFFYRTKDSPDMYSSAHTIRTQLMPRKYEYTMYAEKGVCQFRLEFVPKSNVSGVPKEWPIVDKLLIEGEEISLSEMKRFFHPKLKRPSYDFRR